METSQKPKKWKQAIRRIFISIMICLVGIIAIAALNYKTNTPPFLNSNGEPLVTSIAEERKINLNGNEQYVLIRGQDKSAPLLVYVHGGPGASATPFLRTYNAALENDFVVVYWDQLGTSKSFDSELEPSRLTIAQMTSDLTQLIDKLLVEFNKEKLLLVAHSWGTILALEHVAAHPETIAAYVAVSQTAHQLNSDTEGYEWALTEAKTSGKEKIVSQLETIGKPPYEIDEFFTQRRFVNFLGGALVKPQSDLELLRSALVTPEFAWPNVKAFLQGSSFSAKALWSEQQQYDAFSKHKSIDAPIFLVVGRHDRVISPNIGVQYLESLDAPLKEIHWFEDSAHSPLFEEPQKFNSLVKEIAETVGLLKNQP